MRPRNPAGHRITSHQVPLSHCRRAPCYERGKSALPHSLCFWSVGCGVGVRGRVPGPGSHSSLEARRRRSGTPRSSGGLWSGRHTKLLVTNAGRRSAVNANSTRMGRRSEQNGAHDSRAPYASE
ncbi:hypothetical protein DENSPDRAFT_547582 [Dentipellis sp. KUC8613]|nr:hypothetical protein DENSPDRAFT_547582 [Dentipellis sp. KUC8613]